MQSPWLFDVELTAITVFWHVVVGAKVYEVQMKDSLNGKWSTVTDSLKSTVMRKKNLVSGYTYWFRVRSQDKYGWGDFSASSDGFVTLLRIPEKQMDPPKLIRSDGEKFVISWTAIPSATYEVQYRGDGDHQEDWKFFLVGMNTITKALDQGRSYVFRIRPASIDDVSVTDEWAPGRVGGPWSLYDTPKLYSKIFGDGALITNEGYTVSPRLLPGKVVLVFFGATWCKRSVAFIPKLSTFFDDLRKKNQFFEMVFISLDNNKEDMTKLFESFPTRFLAVPYDCPNRPIALATLSVSQLPRLVAFGNRGQVLCENAISLPLIWSTFESWNNEKVVGAAPRLAGYRAAR